MPALKKTMNNKRKQRCRISCDIAGPDFENFMQWDRAGFGQAGSAFNPARLYPVETAESRALLKENPLYFWSA
jgi:hypothetical protein